jgi:alkylation response protein AidB-like acyl-CoA dehydrogenase
MVYYIGGLKDEDLYLVHDIETSIIQRFAIRIMREAINTLIDVAGITAVNKDFSFEKTLRDVIATMSLAVNNFLLNIIKTIYLRNQI